MRNLADSLFRDPVYVSRGSNVSFTSVSPKPWIYLNYANTIPVYYSSRCVDIIFPLDTQQLPSVLYISFST